ncbi:right-handed parallel beta-helix repeat-containing protein [Methanobrevibacter sp. V74]|uniref:right-handed parallel beta-helix repeat-containing protein n=1 Tax=Methanobrevibacter sp. V74 TaxID=3064279 RepID=UPI002734981B|nr:right-handed parallel beta-helix repeat-containing protein [Methanobrevibacter sp. V74]
MINKKMLTLGIIFLFILIMSISSVSANNITIDSNWTSNDVNNLFNHNSAMGYNLSDGDTVSFNTTSIDNFNNIKFNVNKEVKILGNGIKLKGSNNIVGITLKTNNILIDNTTFEGYKTAITNVNSISNITLQNSKFLEINMYSSFSSITDLKINNNIFNKTSGVGTAILIKDSRNIDVSFNNIGEYYHYGIIIQNTHYFNVNNNRVVSFKIRGQYNDPLVSSGNHYGILMQNSTHSEIFNNYVEKFYEPLDNAKNSSYSNVYNNTVNMSFWGIKFSNGHNGRVYNNTVKDPQIVTVKKSYFVFHMRGNGVYVLEGGSNITIENNNLINAGIYIKENMNTSVRIINNTIFNSTAQGQIDFIIPSYKPTTKSGIYIEGTYGGFVLIENNTISHNAYSGIESDSDATTIIKNNKIYNNTNGISATNAKNLFIIDNLIFDNENNGILIKKGNNVYISSNEIFNNTYGISVSNGKNYTIEFNNISKSEIGIALGHYTNNNENTYKISESKVANNNVTDNSKDGIRVFGDNNTIINNIINRNKLNGLTIEGDGIIIYLI